jgi:hypothetical protein
MRPLLELLPALRTTHLGVASTAENHPSVQREEATAGRRVDLLCRRQ